MKGFSHGGYIGTAKIIGGTAYCAANVERSAGNPPLEAKKDTRFNSPVRIRIISFRCRLCDADGISGKAAIDGLVHCGILEDDGPRFVTEVSYSQVKVKNKEEEKTQLIIEVVQ